MELRHPLKNDIWALELFDFMEGGFFVEAGCTNGKSGSATWNLEKEYGWNGLCVEPNHVMYGKMINAGWRSCHTANVCLYDKEGEITFAEYHDGSDVFRSHIINNCNDKNLPKPDKISVRRCVSLTSLLDEISAPKIIHYCCLDVEGAEYKVLKGIDFNKYKILSMSVEVSKNFTTKCAKLMLKNGYIRSTNKYTDKPFEQYWIHNSITP